MKRMIVVFLMAALLRVGAQEPEVPTLSEGEARAESAGSGSEKSGAEDKSIEEGREDSVPEDEMDEESLDLIEAFYKAPSFQLFPRSRIFRLTNTASASIFYDSNIFLASKDEKDDFGYSTEIISDLEYKPGRFLLELIGGVSYENYFDHSDLGELQPRAQVVMEYKGDTSYCRIEEHFTRHSTIATVEYHDRSPWYENRINLKIGQRMRRWLVEGNLFHTLTDYRKVFGDHQVYGGGLLVGYDIDPQINLTFDYQVRWIDYREATVSEGERQEDTVGHNFALGVEMRFTRRIMGRAKSGLQYREGHYIWSFLTGVTWYATPHFQMEFKFYRGTEPTFSGDYKEWTDLTIELRYLLHPDIALKASVTLADSRPLRGFHSQGCFNDVFLTYNIYEGIVAELSYRGDFVDNVDNKGSDGDYIRHRTGLALRLFF